MDKKIFSEVKDNIGIVWLNRPEKKNALNDELWFGLPELVKELDESDAVSYTHLTLPTILRV